jgi:hypothetical protein
LSHPFQFPRTPTAQRLATTILGPLRSDYAEQLCGCEDGNLATVSSLPPQLCDQLAAQLADNCRTPEELPHFQTIPYLLAILYIIPILWLVIST